MSRHKFNLELPLGDILYTLSCEGYYLKGRYGGPPENCYPDEGEVYSTSIKDESGKEIEYENFLKLVATEREISEIAAEDYLIDCMWERFGEMDDPADYGPEFEYDESDYWEKDKSYE